MENMENIRQQKLKLLRTLKKDIKELFFFEIIERVRELVPQEVRKKKINDLSNSNLDLILNWIFAECDRRHGNAKREEIRQLEFFGEEGEDEADFLREMRGELRGLRNWGQNVFDSIKKLERKTKKELKKNGK